jgi:hypothetical protein
MLEEFLFTKNCPLKLIMHHFKFQSAGSLREDGGEAGTSAGAGGSGLTSRVSA